MYTAEQLDEALRKFAGWLDVDGTKQALEDMLAQGEVRVAGIGEDGAFVFELTDASG